MDNIDLQMKILPIINHSVVVPENEIITYYYVKGDFNLRNALTDIENNYDLKLQNIREVYFNEGVTFYVANCLTLSGQLEAELVPIEDLSDYVSGCVADMVAKLILTKQRKTSSKI